MKGMKCAPFEDASGDLTLPGLPLGQQQREREREREEREREREREREEREREREGGEEREEGGRREMKCAPFEDTSGDLTLPGLPLGNSSQQTHSSMHGPQ